MDLGSILLGVALLGLVAFLVARPLLEGAGPAEPEPDAADSLQAERERVLVALRDLDFDHATGKLTPEDYAAQRAPLAARGAEVLRQLDALAPGPRPEPARAVEDEIEQAIARRRAQPAAPPVSTPRPPSVDDAIEASVAARRQPARFCAQCGQPLQPADRFCGACGAAVRSLTSPGKPGQVVEE